VANSTVDYGYISSVTKRRGSKTRSDNNVGSNKRTLPYVEIRIEDKYTKKIKDHEKIKKRDF
jgi:hypothetical protein